MGKILVVDDEEIILYAMSRALRDIADIKTVATAEKAIHEMNSCFFDVCFLGVVLPGLNGIDAMKKIKEISPGTKVIIMTASCLDEEAMRSIKDGAYHFVAKPFDLAQIREVSKQALA